MDLLNLFTLFFFGIVSAQSTGSALLSNEILINPGKLTLFLETKDINVLGFQTKEYLKSIKAITDALGGLGVFGVELFVKDDEVIFSEVSPRPHDTGLVTLISQDLSEFALHARAILGLPIPNIHQHGPSASSVIMVEGDSTKVNFSNLGAVLAQPNTQLRLFGKPEVKGQRRMGVVVARAESTEKARRIANEASGAVQISL